MMQEMIWMDAAAYMGKGVKTEYSETAEQNYGPENKRECPCDTCPMAAQCLENGTECSAMRNWCSKGDFADKDLMRLVRAMA